jgi:hypothetical protein
LLDLVGNTAVHGHYAADRQWSLDGGLKGLERAVASTWRCRKCHRVHEKTLESGGAMPCVCGNSQKVSGFASAIVEGHAPIAGIPAEQLMAMKFNDAVPHLKTNSDLVAYGKLRNMRRAWP